MSSNTILGSLTLLLLASACLSQNDEDFKKTLEDIFGTEEHPAVVQSTTTTSTSTTTEPVVIKSGDADGDTDLTPVSDSDNPSCTRDDGSAGICVLYYLCDADTKKLITDGSTLIDVRVNQCPKTLQVCCKSKEGATAPAPTAPALTAPHAGCGYSHLGDGDPFRIVNDGTRAEYLEFPWMVAVLRKSDASNSWSEKDYVGGGSLIHPKVVLSAAHKIEGVTADQLKCRAGEWNTQTADEQFKHQERDVAKVTRHKDFYRPSVLNSIALLFLATELDPAQNIGTVCVGAALPPPGAACWSMGWGKEDFESDNAFTATLKKVQLPLLSRAACQTALRRTRLGSFFVLHESLVCAGGVRGRDTCVGDGGSPLVCSVGDPSDLRYAIYGMVAYGIGCGEQGIPGVYVNVPAFHGWIGENVRREGVDPEGYRV